MRKIHLSLLIMALIILVAANLTFAAGITVYLNGQVQAYDPAPVIQKGTTIVPMRAIFEQLGAIIDWDDRTRTVTAARGETLISLSVGQTIAYVNGKPVPLAVPSQIIKGRTMVPLRFVSESLGASVKWDPATWSIYIDDRESSSATEQQGPLEITDIARNSSSVVLVSTFDRTGKAVGFGSGFVVRSGGAIATNYHVIDGAASAAVRFENGTIYNVEYVTAYDKKRDIAVLKIDAASLVPLKIGDSAKCVAGEKVVAIGNPLGLQNTVSDGIISSLNRTVDNQGYIQITAPISPGSSGGPLFNMAGEVVGINTAGFTQGQNLNLAIPINESKNMFDGTLQVPLAELNGITVGGSGSSPLSDQEFADYIYTEYGTRTVGGYTVSLSEVTWLVLKSDGTKCFNLMLDKYELGDFVGAAADGYFAELEDWLYEIAAEAAANYPDERLMVGFMFQDYFDEYPDPFSPDHIDYANGAWLVTWIPVAASVNFGDIYIGKWSAP